MPNHISTVNYTLFTQCACARDLKYGGDQHVWKLYTWQNKNNMLFCSSAVIRE